MKCPICGAQIDGNSRFCTVCGNEISTSQSPSQGQGGSIWNTDDDGFSDGSPSLGHEDRIVPHICPYCGWEVDYGQTSCTRCGRYIPQSLDEFPSVGGDPSGFMAEGEWDTWQEVPQRDWDPGNVDYQPPIVPTGVDPTPTPQPKRSTAAERRKKIGIIVGSAVAVIVVAVGVWLFLGMGASDSGSNSGSSSAGSSTSEPVKNKEPEKPKTGQLIGHFAMSDAEYGTEDFADAIILDRDKDGNSSLLYRGNMMTGVIKRSSEEETTYVYKMSDIKDSSGNSQPDAIVTIEIPKTMSEDNIVGYWRICYRNGKTAISDWAVVDSDGTGKAGFSYQFDIFQETKEYMRTNASRRSWKKTGEGHYRVTAPDKDGVERLIYIAE